MSAIGAPGASVPTPATTPFASTTTTAGSRHNYVPMCHRYRTFGVLAGVLPAEGVVPGVNYEGARVPPLDSLDMWPLLTKKVDSSPRKGFPLSQFAIIQGQYKYDCHMRFAQPRVIAFMLSTIGLLRYVVVPKCCLFWAGQIYQRIHPRS